MKNYWLDVAMGLLVLTVGLSAFLLWVIFPQGYFATRVFWLEIHKWSGRALSVAVVLHVLLHWRWLIRTTKRVMEGFRAHDPNGLRGQSEQFD
jgi:membrane protein implicated in regulation of membrane protease activity